jgi:hypothetical protein
MTHCNYDPTYNPYHTILSWTAVESGFDSRKWQLFLLHCVQIGSGTKPASFQWVPGALSPGLDKAAGA